MSINSKKKPGYKYYTLAQQKIYPMHYAALNGDIKQMQRLIKLDSNIINSIDNTGSKPICLAIISGDLDIVKFLHKYDKTLIDYIGNREWTSMHYAVAYGHLDIVKYLYECNKNLIRSLDSAQYTPMHYANLNLVKFLYENDHNLLNYRNNIGRTPIFNAALDGDIDIVKFMVQCDKKLVNAKDIYGVTPAMLATAGNHLDVVKFIYEQNPSTINDKDDEGDSLMHIAAKGGNKDILEFLFVKNNNLISAKNKAGYIPMQYAAYGYQADMNYSSCQKDNIGVIKFLNKQDKNLINYQSIDGRTPLYFAAHYGDEPIIKLLIEMGAYIDESSLKKEVFGKYLTLVKTANLIDKFFDDKDRQKIDHSLKEDLLTSSSSLTNQELNINSQIFINRFKNKYKEAQSKIDKVALNKSLKIILQKQGKVLPYKIRIEIEKILDSNINSLTQSDKHYSLRQVQLSDRYTAFNSLIMADHKFENDIIFNSIISLVLLARNFLS